MEISKGYNIEVFKNPKGLYQAEIPSRYITSFDNDIFSVVAPGTNSSLTISTHEFESKLNDIDFAGIFQRLTLKYEALQEPYYQTPDVLMQHLKSVKPNQSGDIVTTFWTICIKRILNSMILISVNVDEHENIQVLEDYKVIINSVVN